MSRVSAKVDRELTDEDFKFRQKFTFDKYASTFDKVADFLVKEMNCRRPQNTTLNSKTMRLGCFDTYELYFTSIQPTISSH